MSVHGSYFWCVGYLPARMEACHVLCSYLTRTITPGWHCLQDGGPILHSRSSMRINIVVPSSHISLLTFPCAKFALRAHCNHLCSHASFPEGGLDLNAFRKGHTSPSCLQGCKRQEKQVVALTRTLIHLCPVSKQATFKSMTS